MTDFHDLLHKVEPLHVDLQGWVVDTPLGKMVKHPLVFGPAGVPAFINESYRQKSTAVERAREAQKWYKVIWLHERPYRWFALDQIAQYVTDEERGQLFRDVWMDSENIWQNLPRIRRILRMCPRVKR